MKAYQVCTVNGEKRKCIEFNGELIISDFEKSKNVIKIYDEITVIFTAKKELIRICTKDLDDFIIENTWGYYGANYASTKINMNSLNGMARKYNLAIEGFRLSGNEKATDQKIVYLHRYVMGFYLPEKRKKIEQMYSIEWLKDNNLQGIDDLQVDHDISDSKEIVSINKKMDIKVVNNYSNLMRLVIKEKHTSGKRINVAFNHFRRKYPIFRDDESGNYQLLVKESFSSSKIIAIITDLSPIGENVLSLQDEMVLKEPEMIKQKITTFRNFTTISASQRLKNIESLEREKANYIIVKAMKLEEQKKVIVEVLDNKGKDASLLGFL
ncbi:hypothetical protein [Brevibacillus choshinensis]|uniref:hypothetical protein n=1 Tax=Brevibacillus choshinensis TaxID=54911 RepID=UPI002E24E5F1|nr:hypothetical protein [Brevibacillus choshinensis]